MKNILVIFMVLCFSFPGVAFAQEKRFEAELETDSVSIGEPVYLYLTFYGSRSIDQPDMSSIEGIQIRYIGPSTKVTVINGAVSQSMAHTYLVIPRKAGSFDIGPFFVEHEGRMYKSNIVTLISIDTRVRGAPKTPASPTPPIPSGPVSPPIPGGESRGTSYTGDKVFLVMEMPKRTMYINEIVPVTVKIYVNGVGLKEIEYPTFNHEGFSVGEFTEPERRQEIMHGIRYDVLVFKQNLFGIKEGDYALGPAKLNCKMVTRKKIFASASVFGVNINDDDFFSNRFGYDIYPIELESEKINIKILALPKETKPLDFQGAVGDFTMDAYVEPLEVKAGDPVTLHVTIGGKGDLDTVTAPAFASTENIKAYEVQVTKKLDRKIYDQILIPKTDEVREIPSVSFSFFNPESEKYETIKKGPFPIKVAKQTEAEKATKMVSTLGGDQVFYPQEKLGEDILYIKETLGKVQPQKKFLYKNWLFWLGQIFPIIMAAFFYVASKEKERISKDKRYARYLKAPRKARLALAKAEAYLDRNEILAFYDTVFKMLQGYMSDRLSLPKGSVTIPEIEARIAESKYDKSTIETLHEVFSKCEIARYTSFVPDKNEAQDVLEKVRRIIDYMEKIKLDV